jgi:hypothetical protein
MEPRPITEPTRVNPYGVPADQQGWRGLGLDGLAAHRKSYTLLWNHQVLVCALLLIPGERSIRHSHESGELSITFSDPLHPVVGYTPGGLLHGMPSTSTPEPAKSDATIADDVLRAAGSPVLGELMLKMLEEQRELRRAIERLSAAQPGPRMLVDILFPPFKTTIDDPAYPEPRTIVGPWYD